MIPSPAHKPRRLTRCLLVAVGLALLTAGLALLLCPPSLADQTHEQALGNRPRVDCMASASPLSPYGIEHRLRQIFRRIMRTTRPALPEQHLAERLQAQRHSDAGLPPPVSCKHLSNTPLRL